jgi:hypothetical protein
MLQELSLSQAIGTMEFFQSLLKNEGKQCHLGY